MLVRHDARVPAHLQPEGSGRAADAARVPRAGRGRHGERSQGRRRPLRRRRRRDGSGRGAARRRAPWSRASSIRRRTTSSSTELERAAAAAAKAARRDRGAAARAPPGGSAQPKPAASDSPTTANSAACAYNNSSPRPGVSSRRKAEALIAAGAVRVNGSRGHHPGHQRRTRRTTGSRSTAGASIPRRPSTGCCSSRAPAWPRWRTSGERPDAGALSRATPSPGCRWWRRSTSPPRASCC